MKNLVEHLIANNMDEIAEKSILNCHIKGLHSIMLLECPGKTIRLYVTDEDHDLWKNKSENLLDGTMTLAFHAHHCNLTLDVVRGAIANVNIVKSSSGEFELPKWKYQSQILSGSGGFSRVGSDRFDIESVTHLPIGERINLLAKDIHSVRVPQGVISAWLVYEGKEDDAYESCCWSSNDLSAGVLDGLYGKPTKFDIVRLLKQARLL